MGFLTIAPIFLFTSLFMLHGAEAFSLMKLLGIDKSPPEADGVEYTGGLGKDSQIIVSDTSHVDGPLPRTFTQEAWHQNSDIFDATKQMDMLQELGSGTLRDDTFRYFIIQDAHFIDIHAKVMAVAAAKSLEVKHALFFAQYATFSAYGQTIANYSTSFNLTAETFREEAPSPTTQHYTSFLMSTAMRRPVPVILASLMPCFWYYPKLGHWLRQMPTYDTNQYKVWIDYMILFPPEEAIKLLDSLAENASTDTVQEMHDVFRNSAKLEYMFWEAAYNQQRWPFY